MSKVLAEVFGTAVLVLVGCGSVVMGGYGTGFPLGILPVAFAFGLTVTAMIYTIGPISGCHINPAVTLGLLAAGRMQAREAGTYIVAQMVGGAVGAALLYAIVSGKLSGYDLAQGGLGENGWGQGHLGGYGVSAAFIVEVIATFLFVLAILRLTGKDHFGAIAGLIVGLTLVALHLPFVNVTGLSVNPARSFGPALIVGGKALGQLWLFLIAPVLGGVAAGFADRLMNRA
jgi:aquaporin Z